MADLRRVNKRRQRGSDWASYERPIALSTPHASAFGGLDHAMASVSPPKPFLLARRSGRAVALRGGAVALGLFFRLGADQGAAEDALLVLEQKAPQVAPLEERSPLGLQDRLAWEPGDPVRELQRAREQVTPDDLAHDAQLLGLLGLDEPARQAEVLGDSGRQDRPGGGVTRRDPSRKLRVAEDSRGRGDEKVAQENQGEAAGYRGPVDRGDDRAPALADRLEGQGARLDELPAVLEVAAELARIHACAESGACAGQYDATDMVIVRKATERIRDLLTELDGQRVSLVGSSERDYRDLIAALDRKQPPALRHGATVPGRSMPAPSSRPCVRLRGGVRSAGWGRERRA